MGIYFSLKTPLRPGFERAFPGWHGIRARAGLPSHSKIPPKILTDYPSMAPTWALPKFQVLGLRLLGAFRAAATHTGSIRTTKTQRCGADGPVRSRLGHMRWHRHAHMAPQNRQQVGPGVMSFTGRTTFEVQQRMCGVPGRPTTGPRHSASYAHGAL